MTHMLRLMEIFGVHPTKSLLPSAETTKYDSSPKPFHQQDRTRFPSEYDLQVVSEVLTAFPEVY